MWSIADIGRVRALAVRRSVAECRANRRRRVRACLGSGGVRGLFVQEDGCSECDLVLRGEIDDVPLAVDEQSPEGKSLESRH